MIAATRWLAIPVIAFGHWLVTPNEKRDFQIAATFMTLLAAALIVAGVLVSTREGASVEQKQERARDQIQDAFDNGGIVGPAGPPGQPAPKGPNQ